MAKKLQTKDVAKALSFDIRQDGGSKPYIHMTYRTFSAILLREELCCDDRTIRQKWEIFAAKNIFVNSKSNSAIFDIREFNSQYPEFAIPLLEITAHTRTHTHIDGGVKNE